MPLTSGQWAIGALEVQGGRERRSLRRWPASTAVASSERCREEHFRHQHGGFYGHGFISGGHLVLPVGADRCGHSARMGRS